MRAWIISDLHYSPMDALAGAPLRIAEADICICAGDISENVSMSIAYLRRDIERHMPVILVLGNHDFYNSSIDLALERARREIEGTRIHLLENQTIEIAGCRFVGATLWTDFAVSIGGDEHIPAEERRAIAFGLVPSLMADFSCISRSDPRRPGENGLITVQEILKRHIASRSFIDRELEKPFDGRTFVVTHHAPLIQSFDPRFFGHVTNAAFGSDLSDLITRRRPDVWIHGHVHRFRDYMADGTRVICNPRGYGDERDMGGFRPGFVIDL
ncbi:MULTISPECIES: metallophosphoesterase family protein [Rhizobium]|uniref:metallophosphoesterase family protein n=1 Tax=Rhizobium TaxID=379 RepID=UPI001C906812|nr:MULTISPECIES: metallophosphoesterase family protein [Rhizobium]MBY3342897.1 phosphohydrolase [Rhizobium laguerreae]MBY3349931.1 phosphohydrolase [Rhizobium laguerreae]MBY3371035.1 phosphohydrolase [Rhizobium laguerreae]MBY3426275.1 phosphohydrolase [Rhizobium laguerreae]MBY3434173.1 phosphohydrolase [Rhizobium laguerreae]